MTATNQGSSTIAATVPGYSGALEEVGKALQTLRGVVLAQAAALLALEPICDANGLPNISASLSAGALASASANLSGALDVQAELNATLDAGAYVAGLSADLNAAINFLANTPDVDILANAQAGINAGVGDLGSFEASLSADIGGIDAAFELGGQCVAGLLAISAALTAAAVAVSSALSRYTSAVSEGLAGGVDVVHFAGDASTLGADVQGALGVSGASTAVVLTVPDANTETLANFKSFYGVA